jgi:hypothetical protein
MEIGRPVPHFSASNGRIADWHVADRRSKEKVPTSFISSALWGRRSGVLSLTGPWQRAFEIVRKTILVRTKATPQFGGETRTPKSP